MDKMNMHVKKIINICVIFVLILAVGTVIYAGVVSPPTKEGSDRMWIEFSSDWNYQVDEKLVTISLPYKEVSASARTFVLFKQLPPVLPKDAVIYIKINHNDLKAYVADHELFVKGIYNDRTFGISTSETYATVYLEPDCAGQTITLVGTELNNVSGINFEEISITNQNDLTNSLLRKNALVLILLVSMATIAVILFILAFVCRRKMDKDKYIVFLYLSLFIVLATLWVLFDSQIIDLYLGHNDYQYFSSFFTLMLMPIPFALFMREVLDNGKKIFNIIILLFIIAFLSTEVLLFFGKITSLISPMLVFHILILLLMIASVAVSIVEYMKSHKKHTTYLIIALCIFIAVSVIALWAFYQDNIIYASWFQVGFFSFVIFLSIGALQYATVIVSQAAESQYNKKKAYQAQNNLMVSQISTHFFFHVMNTARVLIKTNPESAYKMLGDISKYLRYKTDSSEIVGSLVKFSDEMKSIKAYVDMKKILLGDRLQTVFEINCDDFYIPVLSIQPLVENAIKHGIEPKAGGGTVWIIVNDENDYYSVTVQDDGVGFDKEMQIDNRRISVSQKNIEERLAYYGENRIKIHSIPGIGTKVNIRIQKGLEKKDEDNFGR